MAASGGYFRHLAKLLVLLLIGKLRGRVGVFPSNFVEMIKASAPANDDEQTVADKNKRNEKLKGKNFGLHHANLISLLWAL